MNDTAERKAASNVSVMNFADIETPELKEAKVRGKEYVGYGVNNKYPEFLWKLYTDCADHQSIIDGMVNYVIGEGIETTNPKLAAFFKMVNPDESINDVAKKLLIDYFIFGGFCPQIIPENSGALKELHWANFMNCRISEDENTVFYSKEWGNWGAKADAFPNFNPKKPTQEQMFYFKGHKTRGVYPIPLYNGAIKSIQTAIEIAQFHLNNIANGFQVNTIINFNNGIPEQKEKELIERGIKDKFASTKGSKIMTTFNESKDKAAEVVKLNADDFGEQFGTLAKSTQQTIFTAHRVTSPALFGIKMENTGFSKTEYMEAFDIFNSTIVRGYQNVLISELTKMLKPYFGNELGINIKPYQLNVEGVNNGRL